MTLINTNKLNFKNFKKESYNEKFIIFLFSFLPISLILGNSAINSNILIIDLFFLLTCFRQKQWSWIRNKYFYFFISIWIYLVINSAISENFLSSFFDPIRKEIVYPEIDSIIRSVGFIRFIIFLFAVQYFFINLKKAFDKIFLYWTVIIFIVLIDVVFERIIGFNLLGFKSSSPLRIVSFFEDELVVGGFILGFSFLISGYLFKSTKNNQKKIFSNIFFYLSIFCIYLSGERSNFIKAAIITSIILLLIEDVHIYIKKKYIFLFIIIGIALTTLIHKEVYSRQIQFFKMISKAHHSAGTQGTIYERFGHIRHFAHYDTAWEIFKDYPIFGVGNLKFRYICHDNKYLNTKIIYTYQRCSNHPHQVHLEILSEQGIIGYLIIIFAIFSILFNSFKVYRKTGDLIHLSSILFVLTFFIPLLPTGSLFSTFNGSIFWINFSLAHAFLNKPND
jgi:O-antigen ligase